MDLLKQYCSAEQAFKLKELGIIDSEPSYFFQEIRSPGKYVLSRKLLNVMQPFAIAYSVSELGVMLGKGFPSWQFTHPETGEDTWIATRLAPNNPQAEHKQHILPMNTYTCCDRYRPTEADVRATLLIACIEVGMESFSLEEVNERLKAS